MRNIQFHEPTGRLTPSAANAALALVGYRLRRTASSPLELLLAYDWAIRAHLRAADNRVQTRPCPTAIVMRGVSHPSRNLCSLA